VGVLTVPLNFTGPKHLLSWLQHHAKGQTFWHDATVAMCEECRHARRPVLLILHPDGAVELYHGRGLQVHVVHAFRVDTEAREEWQARYISFRLPPVFRPLYTGWKQGYVGKCWEKTIDDELEHLRSLIFLRDVDAWRQRYRDKFGAKAIDEIARDVRVTMFEGAGYEIPETGND
jgi:hypothetical protein